MSKAGKVALIVEDNEMNMELLGEVLEMAGYSVIRAVEPVQALAMAAEQKPDVVLMDVQLPGMDGLEATRRLKANPDTEPIPVVAVTSHAMKGERDKAVEAGCAGYFSKPIDVSSFADELKKILEELDRTVSGTFSASFSGKGRVRGPFVGERQGKAMLAKGNISFQGPVLGMEKLAFDQLSSQVSYRSGQIHLQEGKVESRLLEADFAGTVKPVEGISPSIVNLQGSLSPRSEFLSGIGDQVAVDLLKSQLKEGKLSFTINGALREPGIVFAGLPPEFNQQLQGGGN